mgnify:FL=1
MNIGKAVGVVTAGIPIVGILIGGITFGINFKTDVTNIKEDVAHQQTVNADMEERFSEINVAPYDDTLIWLQADTINERIDNIYIPDEFDDFYLDERIQTLALQVTALRTELNGLDIQDMEAFDDSALRGRLAELEGQLNALASIDMTSDGSVDLGPLVVRIASAEGSIDSLKSSITTIKSDMRTIKSDVTSVERVANSAKSTADSAKSSSGGSRTVENNYDDSNLRSRVSDLERQVNALPTTSSGSGTTIQRVENDFNDASLRADISALQTAVAVLQATGSTSYDDSNLRDMIDDIQWDLDNLDIPTFTTTDVSWLEDLMYSIKNELSMRIDELEWASDTTSTTSDDMYAEKWMLEDLQSEVMFVQEQVWELQTLINDSQTTSNNNNTTTGNNSSSTTTAGRSWDGAWDEPYWIYVDHQQDSYTGDYWMDGYWNGEPVWVNWECGIANTQFEYCYVFKYNYASWVIQPLEPSNEWLANAYTDGQWPWSGTWNGDVNSVENKS